MAHAAGADPSDAVRHQVFLIWWWAVRRCGGRRRGRGAPPAGSSSRLGRVGATRRTMPVSSTAPTSEAASPDGRSARRAGWCARWRTVCGCCRTPACRDFGSSPIDGSSSRISRRVEDQRPGQLDLLLLAAGQRPGVLAGAACGRSGTAGHGLLEPGRSSRASPRM